MLISVPVFGQSVDYNKIILPESSRSVDFGEKLVQLAWRNHPSNEVFRRQVNIAAFDVKKNSASWLDIIHLQGNINEFVLNPQADAFGRAVFFPKYNIRADISLGMFLTIPYETKKSREQVIIAQSNVNAQKLAVRNEVLKTYNEFLMRERIFKLQSQTLLDTETSHKLMEQQFRNGEITFETYSTSLTAYNATIIAQLEAEKEYKNAKLNLEQWIGMRLEDVR